MPMTLPKSTTRGCRKEGSWSDDGDRANGAASHLRDPVCIDALKTQPFGTVFEGGKTFSEFVEARNQMRVGCAVTEIDPRRRFVDRMVIAMRDAARNRRRAAGIT